MGTWRRKLELAASSSTIFANEAELYGHPSDTPCPGGSCRFPLLWGQTQDAGHIGPGGEEHQMFTQFDITGGIAFAVWNMAPGYPEVIGVLLGFRSDDLTYNRIVRLDSVSARFIATYSAL